MNYPADGNDWAEVWSEYGCLFTAAGLGYYAARREMYARAAGWTFMRCTLEHAADEWKEERLIELERISDRRHGLGGRP